ncbi:MAG TPA: glycosyltransferase family 4 protein [Anaeromyxobacteraceae bacterium]|nr:glycosyltransferase family 4 protein [Anaeromyxobacteraceae bacterium]
MRVLLVTGSYPPMACGVGDYTRSLAQALSLSPGVQVAVLTSTEAAATSANSGCEVFPIVRDWGEPDRATVEGLARAWRPDIVHVQFPTLGYRGALAPRLPSLFGKMGLPVVQTWHEYFPLYFPVRVGMLERLAMGPGLGDVIVVRPGYQRRMRAWQRVLTAGKRFHLIPNASSVPRAELSSAERLELRRRYAPDGKALLAFFGFFFEHKGIDDLLAVMDPAKHQLVLIGEGRESDPYQAELLRRVRGPLASSVSEAGFLPPEEVARLLAVADAVVLPFRNGGGSWNTSIQAGTLQGTFVLTTSNERHGLDPHRNVYYARPGDIDDLRRGLESHLGRRNHGPPPDPTWPEIASRHIEVYQSQRRGQPSS